MNAIRMATTVTGAAHLRMDAPLPHPLLDHVRTQLADLQALVRHLSAGDYLAPVPVLGNASLGQHVRHILEFYICLMEACGEVDYDARARDKAIETERGAALVKLDKLRWWMGGVCADAPLVLVADHSIDGTSCERMNTSLYRELAYAFDHAIHHLALLRIGIEQQHPGFVLHPDLGVAPSTIRNRNRCAR